MKSAKVIQRSLFEEPISLASSFSSFCKAIGVEEGMNWADRFGRALRHWTASSSMQPIRTLSLFSGVGGLDIGFHDAGSA